MSLAPTALAGPRAPSPASQFSSNNPFRRNISPGPVIPTDTQTTRSNMSNNPFLDPPGRPMASFQTQQQQQQQQQNPFGEDLFKDLTLLDQPVPTTTAPPVRAPARTGKMPVGSHRPSRSTTEEDEGRRRRAPPRPQAPPSGGLDIFSSPPKTESRRPRRNSESSIIDTRKAADDDARRRERRKEREARREKDGKSKDGKSSRTKKPQGLDLIDKLDVTGIYGQGLFHHDGPFDACNPHRNRKKDYRAPMQAFPVNSANNVLGGSGPVNANVDLDRFHGRGQEGFNDFATSGSNPKAAQKQTESFNAKQNIEPVHGEESYGLGTSTFLEGAPAPKRAVQPGDSDDDELHAMQGPGLGRKKSLAVRLRGLSQPRRTDTDRIVSPDARYSPQSPGTGIQSAGGVSRARYGPSNEANPFFNDYDDAYEKKGSQIRIAEGTNRPRAPSSPRPVGLRRSITTESDGPEKGSGGGGGGGGGFLNRMKSLKGPRRPRPERRVS